MPIIQYLGTNANDSYNGSPFWPDYISGGNYGDDTLSGLGGNDSIYGEYGNDQLYGGDGADSLSGGYDNDVLYGGADGDVLYGEWGTDALYGDVGNDTLSGGSVYDNNGDTLTGGAGNDSMTGGGGADVFRYAKNFDGSDVITDFTRGTFNFSGDKIEFTDSELMAAWGTTYGLDSNGDGLINDPDAGVDVYSSANPHPTYGVGLQVSIHWGGSVFLKGLSELSTADFLLT
jgi:Ca2+-binding RTX toxin-like protein